MSYGCKIYWGYTIKLMVSNMSKITWLEGIIVIGGFFQLIVFII